MALERSVLVLLASLLLAALPRPAAGDPLSPPPRLQPAGAVEILASLEDPVARSDRLALELRRVNVNGKYGLIYSRQFQMGERGVEFRLRGPALGRKRRVGLSFEARF